MYGSWGHEPWIKGTRTMEAYFKVRVLTNLKM